MFLFCRQYVKVKDVFLPVIVLSFQFCLYLNVDCRNILEQKKMFSLNKRSPLNSSIDVTFDLSRFRLD